MSTPISPKVSVCVITYNQVDYIRQCLDSLVTQETDFEFEIVVGDDFSTDGTREIVEEYVGMYPHLVRANLQPTNTGGARNYLEVHAAARGMYVAHMDGDDYALPGKLKAQVEALDSDPGCTAVWHPTDLFDDQGVFGSGLSADLSVFPGGRVQFHDAIQLGYVGVHSSLMYRRSARPEVPFDRRLLDLHLTWELLSRGHGLVLDRVLGRYRVGAPNSLSKAHRNVRLLALDHAREFIERFPDKRKYFSVYALTNAILDIRWKSTTALDFFKYFLKHGKFSDIFSVFPNIIRLRGLRVRSTRR